jgi:hypothetical protein
VSHQTILQRQKTLGEAISTEISEQNELLDHLDQDVDRTAGKLGRTKRQMVRVLPQGLKSKMRRRADPAALFFQNRLN